MKLQKLTIHNIASIEDAVIDFESEPLVSSEVFLICGKTGSGKSTILDAICLALYAKTPRLESTKMQGDTQDGDKTVKISDPRQLMRRNTGEASSTLTFTGSNGIHYEATWSAARARNRASGNLQSKKWSLKNIDTGYTLTKDDEIRDEMKEAIGLDFNQFCRTTMLAQGEFTRFLNSRDEEKAAILEKITGVDIYSKIGKKVYEVHAAKEAQWQDARKLIESIAVLSEEEISHNKEKLAAIETEYINVKGLRDSEYSKRQWLVRENELQEKILKAENGCRKAEEAAREENFVRKEQLVYLWNKTIDARQWLRDGIRAKQEKQKLEMSLSGFAEKYIYLLSGMKYSTAEISDIERTLLEVNGFLQSEKDKEEIYANVQTVCGLLDTVLYGRRIIEGEKAKISIEEELIERELIKMENAAKDEAGAKTAFVEKKELYEKEEEKLAAADLPSVRRQKESHIEMISAIEYAIECSNNHDKEKERSRKKQEHIADMCISINNLKERLSVVGPKIHDAQIRMEERRKSLEEQRASVDGWSRQIRSRLNIGDICPVCRQAIDNEFPHEDYLNELYAKAENAFHEAEKAFTGLTEQQNMLNSDIKAQQMLYQNEIKAFEEDRTLQAAEAKSIAACRKCGIGTVGADTVNILKNKLEKENISKKEIEAKISEAEAAEAAAKELQRAMEIQRKAWEASMDKAAGIKKAIDESRSRVAASQGIIKTKAKEISDAESKAENIIGTLQLKYDWREKTEDFRKELTDSAEKYIRCTRKQQTVKAEYNEKRIIMGNIESSISAIIGIVPEWSGLTATDTAKITGLQEAFAKLLGDVRSAKDLIFRAENSIMEARGRLSEYLKAETSITVEILTALNQYRQEQIKAMSDTINDVHNALLVQNTALQEARKLQEEHFTKKPVIEDCETIESLSESIADKEKRLSALDEAKGAILQELKTDTENKAKLSTLISDAENKKEECQKWARMNQLIGDATGSKFRKIAQSYVLANLIHSANTYMKTLTDRYTLSVNPGTFVISIEDAYQGYARRAASTISGGESFLVSLSLALALSDIGQHLSVDTLFIDEGFGTLSGEALQNAVNTLRSLHTKAGRHVGIISHVEELRERIPVQIKVEQEGRNSSSTVRVFRY